MLKKNILQKPVLTGFLGLCISLLSGAVIVACGGSGDSSSGTPTGTTGNTNPGSQVVGPPWLSYGHNAQHDALSEVATQAYKSIVWQTAVDTAPQYTQQGYLLAHYGSPVITARNTVLVPVKTSATGSYRMEAHSGATGVLLWSERSDYIMPAHRWLPSYNLTLTASNRVYAPGAGGKVLYHEDADATNGVLRTAVFYGESVYNANKAALDQAVIINTPITADAQNNIYFGFYADASNPAGLTSGIARISADGKAVWVGVKSISGVASLDKPATNSAIAVSKDQKTIYVVVNNNLVKGVDQTGYLLALDSNSLALKSKARLTDPLEKGDAAVTDDSTSAPLVGPDGDVYIGVIEQTFGNHNGRGWLLHFNADLSQSKTPGSFGWDDTPSIVPANLVASYTGTSSYLLMVKYNNYDDIGSGDAKNRIAILDPNAEAPDFISPLNTMKEVITMLGLSPDPHAPGGFAEWCINTAAIDPFTKSVIVNSEDGVLYRWDLTSNKVSEQIRLTSGLGESYTPTAIGPDGKVYAINNAILFAVGK